MEKTEALMREYETLREEALGSMSNRAQIVSFGLATVGVLSAGVFASEVAAQEVGLILLVFNAAVPTISVVVTYMWFGEVERMVRAGRFIAALEGRINAQIDPSEPTLRWQSERTGEAGRMDYPYVVVLALFLGMAATSPLVGFLTSDLAWGGHWWALASPWALVLGASGHLALRREKFLAAGYV